VAHFVCPWWGGYFIDNPIRRLLHPPEQILRPFLAPGMTVLDFGCGMGVFTIAMAQLLGSQGKVIAADLQPQMLAALKRRADRAGLTARVDTHLCRENSLDLTDHVDFALAFWSAHEVPHMTRLITEIYHALVDGASLLVVEPRGHVTVRSFREMVDIAQSIGFVAREEPPSIRLSHTAVLTRRRRRPS